METNEKPLTTTPTIPIGVWNIPSDCKAFVRNGQVFVCKKKVPVSEPRCRDCRYFTRGISKYNQNPNFPSPICLRKPKSNERTSYAPQVKIQTRYFSTQPSYRACDMFEELRQEDIKQ